MPEGMQSRHGEPFFLVMALVVAVLVFLGFAPSFFLRDSALEPLSAGLHLHGLIFTAWIALLVTQAGLIQAGRYRVHMTLGLSSLVLVALMAVSGVWAMKDAYLRGVDAFGSPANFAIVPLLDIVGFVAIYLAGLAFRKHPSTHKRLMLLATIYALLPATARMGFHMFGNEVIGLVIQMGLFLIVIGYDLLSRRALHPATLIIFAASLVRVVLIFTVGASEGWARLVAHVLG